VATYFTIVLGLFQVASIIELFFVLDQIKKAAKENQTEPNPPPLCAIATTYIFATLTSIACIGALIYWLVDYNN